MTGPRVTHSSFSIPGSDHVVWHVANRPASTQGRFKNDKGFTTKGSLGILESSKFVGKILEDGLLCTTPIDWSELVPTNVAGKSMCAAHVVERGA